MRSNRPHKGTEIDEVARPGAVDLADRNEPNRGVRRPRYQLVDVMSVGAHPIAGWQPFALRAGGSQPLRGRGRRGCFDELGRNGNVVKFGQRSTSSGSRLTRLSYV